MDDGAMGMSLSQMKYMDTSPLILDWRAGHQVTPLFCHQMMDIGVVLIYPTVTLGVSTSWSVQDQIARHLVTPPPPHHMKDNGVIQVFQTKHTL